jgi:UDP-N-acetylglucosamine--N-acetylmuramyl-(pentapeptide) pyrophosphoryl-undecaprenol N-acetylglucosamine transferase
MRTFPANPGLLITRIARRAARDRSVAKLILYGVSPIGFGHASRAAAIGLKLRERSLEPEFATGGRAVEFLESYGFKVHDVVSEPIPSESHGEMKMASLWYLRYWRDYRSTSKKMAALVEKLSPQLIVGDEEFSSVSLAIEHGIEHAMISDELQLGFARSAIARTIETRASRWYADLQRNVSNLLIPSFGTDSGNIHYMAPVTREVTQSREATRKAQALPLDLDLILFSASGSGIGGFLLHRSLEAFRRVCKRSEVFATSGLGLSEAKGGDVRELGVVRDNQNLVAAADLVISTAGKSTIDECVSSGTPMIAIPIKNHAEQERNAAELGFEFKDLDRLDVLIPRLLGKRTQPAQYNGAERIADFLASLLPLQTR